MDEVKLIVGGATLNRFKSYSLDSDLFEAADAFSFDVSGSDVTIDPGMIARVQINNRPELVGIVDVVEDDDSKDGESGTVRGRDFMGLLVDHYCEEYGDVEALQNASLKTVAERLIRDVPFINRKSVVYKDGTEKLDHPYRMVHIEPGRTVFEILSEYAAGRGFLFYAEPEGTFVFGKPKSSGAAQFSITRRNDGRGNNVMTARRTRDISEAYSRVVVFGQCDEGNEWGAVVTSKNVRSTATMSEFPYVKPFVTQTNLDDQSPGLEAQRHIERMRSKMLSLEYSVSGHSQSGRNWTCNEICHVNDERRGVNGDYLIVRRTFENSKENGTTTRIKLGRLGMVIA